MALWLETFHCLEHLDNLAQLKISVIVKNFECDPIQRVCRVAFYVSNTNNKMRKFILNAYYFYSAAFK